MDQEKIGKFIKDLRIKNNLTQEQFASTLGVTYQAVSKWENGKNIPDIAILKTICSTYGVDIDELINGTAKKKSQRIYYIIILVSIFLIGLIVFLFWPHSTMSYNFRSVSSTCDEYKITGVAAFDATKSSLYISSIEYCGDKNDTVYDNLTCNLYETYNNEKKIISACEEDKHKTIENYIKNISIRVENYASVCKDFSNANLILEIIGEKEGMDTYNHEIPISVDTCP